MALQVVSNKHLRKKEFQSYTCSSEYRKRWNTSYLLYKSYMTLILYSPLDRENIKKENYRKII